MNQYRVPNINHVALTGNITQDPENRSTEKVNVLSFSMANTQRYFDKNTNEWKDSPTTYIKVVSFRDLAKRMTEVLKKGNAVYVEGTLRTNSWETKEGEKRSTIEINAQRIQSLNKTEAAEPTASAPTAPMTAPPPPTPEEEKLPF